MHHFFIARGTSVVASEVVASLLIRSERAARAIDGSRR
jgi:hypothetical protein